jgi:hypothetical protein
MLKAEATGPRVPAIMGKADDANHQRLARQPSAAIPSLRHGDGKSIAKVSSPRAQMGPVAGDVNLVRRMLVNLGAGIVHIGPKN